MDSGSCGPIIDSEMKNGQIDLTQFEDFTIPVIEEKKKDKLDPDDPKTWTPEYCINQAIELMHIRHEMQDIIAKNFEDCLRNKYSTLTFQIPRTLFRSLAPKCEKNQTIRYEEIHQTKMFQQCPVGVAVVAKNASNQESVFANELRRKPFNLHYDPKGQRVTIKPEVICLEGGIPAILDFRIGRNCCAYNYQTLVKGIDKNAIMRKRKKIAVSKTKRFKNKSHIYYI